MAEGAVRIAVVGAESTGKTTLAAALAQRLAAETGLTATWVPEHLRDWCSERGRTPWPDEQEPIARRQHALIEAAAATHAIVVCDTTALMTAVYSRLLFDDHSLDAAAVALHRTMALTLLTAIDIPWVADGLMRDGPRVQAPVDDLLVELLVRHALPWARIGGSGERRLEAALDAVSPLLRRHPAPGGGLFTRLAQRNAEPAARPWRCDLCDDPDCERALHRPGRTP
jgi:nicotinamide riboside kinase